VKVLFLGNSNEALDLPEGSPRRHEIMQAELAAEFGEAEIILKPAWPTEGFPKVLERWIAEIQPDVVYLNVAEYWCLYESIPLRIERRFGKFGKRVAGAGTKAAETPWLAHNRFWRGVRQAGQSVVAGAVYFEPQMLVPRIMECVRVALRSEGVVLIVDGQRGRRPHATTRRWRDRVEVRRQYVHARLKEECARLHVVYGGDDVPQWRTHPEGMDGHRDGLHQGAAGQVWMANEALALIREALAAEGRAAAPANAG
jgi:hypothetical protein